MAVKELDFRKVNNWGNGWRKLVEWDSVKRVYIYKEKEIFPLSYKEQYEMPLHLQNEYYWSEISMIESRIELDKKALEQTQHERKNFDEEWKEICEMLGW